MRDDKGALKSALKHRRRESGAAAVEFALVLPVFMAFVFGILEGGRLMEAQHAVTAAARAGAREAVLSNSTTASTNAAALGALRAAGISTVGIVPTISPSNPATAASGTPVSVTVTLPYATVSWVGMYFRGVQVTAKTTLRKED
jgi:Flp pilus assembly protein TadG